MLRRTMRCSFCGRRDSEVAKLVAGPFRLFAGRVYICDRCAAQTIQIMDARSGDDQSRGATQSLCGGP
jgi:ATP-dependent protease Clp ATPase subunit